MLEIAPGVYTAPQMTRAVRQRVWEVCREWHAELREGAIVMTWHDEACPGSQGVLILGDPPKELCDHEGVLLAKGDVPTELVDVDEESGSTPPHDSTA
jgi:CRISPR-associated protein Cas2